MTRVVPGSEIADSTSSHEQRVKPGESGGGLGPGGAGNGEGGGGVADADGARDGEEVERGVRDRPRGGGGGGGGGGRGDAADEQQQARGGESRVQVHPVYETGTSTLQYSTR